MASVIGPSIIPDSVFTTGPIENKEELANNTETMNAGPTDELANNNDSMDATPTDEPQPQQLHRIFKYHKSPETDRGIVIFNTDEPTLNYYENLYRIHSLIDEKHDNTDGKRVSEYLKNKVYKKNVIDAINYSTVGSVSSFSTGVTVPTLRPYSVNNTVTTLHDALERLGDSFIIEIKNNQYTAPTLPSLQILPWNCFRTIIRDELANNMVVYKGFDTINGCTNENAGDSVKLEMGIQSTGYVHDVGPTGLFNRITANVGGDGQRRNIVSGKLDSSPVNGEFTYQEQQIENLQTLIPFMDIYNNNEEAGGELIGIIMIYIAPCDIENGDYNVFLAFKFFQITTGNYAPIYTIDEIRTILGQTRTQNIALLQVTGWFSYVVDDAVPNLPEIAQYMSGANGCFPAILKKMFGFSSIIYNKCRPYEAIGIQLFGTIRRTIGNTIGNTTIFEGRQDLFIMAFLMKIKWIGDLSRLIDSFMITEVYNLPTATATVDGFMKRFACLSNLYVYCANKNGGDLTINDVKTLTLAQIAVLDAQQQSQSAALAAAAAARIQDDRQDKIYKIITKMKWYKDLIEQLNQFDNNNWIPRQVILILNGILGEGAVEMEKLRFSSRIISTVVSCLGKQTFMYEKVKFTYTEMQSILDYFLTLFYYHIVFDYFKSSPFTYQNNEYANIFDFVLTQSSAMSIDLTNGRGIVTIEDFFTSQCHKSDIDLSIINNGNPGGFISYYETLFNTIDERMNILEKYNNISKIIPQYSDVNSRHRTLFDDSLYLLSKNIAEINTAKQVVQQLMPQTIPASQIPELSYEPNVGNTIRTHFGIFINQRIFPQQGGMPTKTTFTPRRLSVKELTQEKNEIEREEKKKQRDIELQERRDKKKKQLKDSKRNLVDALASYNESYNEEEEEENSIHIDFIYPIDISGYMEISADEIPQFLELKFQIYSEYLNIPIDQHYYRHHIENINLCRQRILHALHELNENFNGDVNNQIIKQTEFFSKLETKLIFNLLYKTIYYPYETDIIFNKLFKTPSSYNETSDFFRDKNFRDKKFTILYKLAFRQIKEHIDFFQHNNINQIQQHYKTYTDYLNAYRDLKEDINTINSVYTDIFIEKKIESLVESYGSGEVPVLNNEYFTTNVFCRILEKPSLIRPDIFYNIRPLSVFRGGSSKKNRRTKKKTSKTNKPNKKNTRKAHPKKSNKRTKRKLSK